MAEKLSVGAQPRAVALVLAFGTLLLQLAGSTAATQRQVMQNAHELSAHDLGNPKYYFYNEITNEVQWDDPGGALLCTLLPPKPVSCSIFVGCCGAQCCSCKLGRHPCNSCANRMRLLAFVCCTSESDAVCYQFTQCLCVLLLVEHGHHNARVHISDLHKA